MAMRRMYEFSTRLWRMQSATTTRITKRRNTPPVASMHTKLFRRRQRGSPKTTQYQMERLYSVWPESLREEVLSGGVEVESPKVSLAENDTVPARRGVSSRV